MTNRDFSNVFIGVRMFDFVNKLKIENACICENVFAMYDLKHFFFKQFGDFFSVEMFGIVMMIEKC